MKMDCCSWFQLGGFIILHYPVKMKSKNMWANSQSRLGVDSVKSVVSFFLPINFVGFILVFRVFNSFHNNFVYCIRERILRQKNKFWATYLLAKVKMKGQVNKQTLFLFLFLWVGVWEINETVFFLFLLCVLWPHA